MDVIEFWLIPQVLHSLAVHFPIALGFAGLLLVYAAAISNKAQKPLRVVAIANYLVLAGTAFLAKLSGERAREELSGAMPGAIWDVVSQHEWFAEKVWILGLITAVILIWAVVDVPWLRTTAMALAMAASLVTAIWIGVAGHLGGTLVYVHGLGLPEQAVPWKELDEQPPTEDEPADSEDAVEPPDGSQDTPALEPEEPVSEVVPIEPISASEAAMIRYGEHIRPLLETHCLECHSGEEPASQLNLATVTGMLAGGEIHGSAIIPGKPDESPLIRRVRGLERPRMPKDGEPLTKAEVHMLRLWIANGAQSGSPNAS